MEVAGRQARIAAFLPGCEVSERFAQAMCFGEPATWEGLFVTGDDVRRRRLQGGSTFGLRTG